MVMYLKKKMKEICFNNTMNSHILRLDNLETMNNTPLISISMSKKIFILMLLLLLPLSICADETETVTFDFKEYYQKGKSPSSIEKNGITLRFHNREGGDITPILKKGKKKDDKDVWLHLQDGKDILVVEGGRCMITSITFIIKGEREQFALYKEVGKLQGSRRKTNKNKVSYSQEWTGEETSVSFRPFSTANISISSVKVSYKKQVQIGIPVNVSSAERATFFYSDKSFVIPKGVIARTYRIDKNILSESLRYEEGQVLPKATAVVLEAQEGHYFFLESSSAGSPDPNNALRGSDTKTQTTGGEVYYLFAKGSKGVGFYWKNPNGEPFENEPHKAYIAYSPSRVTMAKSFLGFDETLGIQGPEQCVDDSYDGLIYNISGQRVGRQYKGIVIIKGKKYLVR